MNCGHDDSGNEIHEYHNSNNINSTGSNESGIHLALFKLFRLYHVLDPNGPKLFNRNVYRLAWVVINVVIGLIVLLSLVSQCFKRDRVVAGDDVFVQLLFYLIYSLYLLKCFTLVRRADDLWRLLDGTREQFLASGRCREHVGLFREHRAKSIRSTNVLCAFGFVVGSQWFVFPVLVNASLSGTRADDPARRYENVFNLVYPVSARAYNDHYAAFYALEMGISCFMLYITVMFDALMISFCYQFIGHYEIVALSMENLGSEWNNRGTDARDQHFRMVICYDDFRSILIDLQNIYLKLKSFYSIVRLITLSYVVLHSGLIIYLTYSLVMVFLSSEAVPILKTIKLSSAFVYLLFVLFYVSYLMENINIHKESIKYSMYSCNWTMMDLKMKMLLVFAMRMEDANKMMIKITPKKNINLRLFCRVMLTCYNIVSFMLNVSSNKSRDV